MHHADAFDCQLYLTLYPWTSQTNGRYCFLLIPNIYDQSSGTICYPDRLHTDSNTGAKADKFRAVRTTQWTRMALDHAHGSRVEHLRRAILEVPVDRLLEDGGASWALSVLRTLDSSALVRHPSKSLLARCVHDSSIRVGLMYSWLRELDNARQHRNASADRAASVTSNAQLNPRGRFLETNLDAEDMFWLDLAREPKRVQFEPDQTQGSADVRQVQGKKLPAPVKHSDLEARPHIRRRDSGRNKNFGARAQTAHEKTW